MKKRDLYAELAEGFEALAKVREGKGTLRAHKTEIKPAHEVTAEDLLAMRERLKRRGRYLRTIYERILGPSRTGSKVAQSRMRRRRC